MGLTSAQGKANTAGRDPAYDLVTDELLEWSWKLYDDFSDSARVTPSIPITHFGDSGAYRESSLRILTVGLNPSRREFPASHPFARFPAAGVDGSAARAPSAHRRALDDYFGALPYMGWFSAYEPVLAGAGSTYLPGGNAAAVHTDICSPLATDPTWTGLSEQQRACLEPDGSRLWHALIRQLRPHLLVASVAARHLDKVRFRAVSDPEVLLTVERANPFVAWQRWIAIDDGHRTLLVWGRPANRPFGTVGAVDRQRIGAAAREAFARG